MFRIDTRHCRRRDLRRFSFACIVATAVGFFPSAHASADGAVQQSNAEMFYWAANDWDVVMKPFATHVCFLTRVSGNLGGNSIILLHRSTGDLQAEWRLNGLIPFGPLPDDGPTWKLSGVQGTSNSLIAESACVPLENFVSEPGFVRWQTEGVWYAGIDPLSRPGCSDTKVAETWNGDAATFLSGIQGNFEGGGEVAEIIQGGPETPSQLRLHIEQCNYIFEARARSLYVGISGDTAMWIYPHTLSAGRGETKTETLMATRDGVCYLSRVSGDFDGDGERLRIYPEVDSDGIERWKFEAVADRGSAYGTASCIPFDQRWGCVAPGVPCL